METTQLQYWLALNEVPNIGGSRALKLLQNITLQTLFQDPTQAQQYCKLNHQQLQAINQPDWQAINQHIAWLEGHDNRHIITIADPDYPLALKNVPSPPMILYVEGDVSLLNSPQIAMVGTRNPSYYGKRYAHSLAAELADSGLTITSGLAIGIDSECHKSVLDAGGKTIAVLGTGLANIYPKRHKKLAAQIIENGALVSEFKKSEGISPRDRRWTWLFGERKLVTAAKRMFRDTASHVPCIFKSRPPKIFSRSSQK